jgi:hypothetical protein
VIKEEAGVTHVSHPAIAVGIGAIQVQDCHVLRPRSDNVLDPTAISPIQCRTTAARTAPYKWVKACGVIAGDRGAWCDGCIGDIAIGSLVNQVQDCHVLRPRSDRV